jgi:osmoprotectant transport system permease protein
LIGLLAAAGPVIPDFGGGGANSCVRENKLFCWDWFNDNFDSVLKPALGQHIKLTLIAVAFGFVIATSLAIAAHYRRVVERPVTVVTGILYTIPSIALFQVLVPITGLKVLTAEIGLVSYTLLIIFRNTLAGLRGVAPEVRDAADGMGLTRWQRLWKVELPLALPAIIAGLRIAVVTVISLATIAAYIIDEGLGSPILRAIGQNVFKTEIIAAGVLIIILALLSDALLAGVQRVLTPWARR